MRSVRLPGLTLLAVAVALLGGCASGGGAPAAEPRSGLLPQPSVVDVLRIDPCPMLDDRQQGALAVTRERPGGGTVNGVPTNGCAWPAADGWGYTAQTFPVGAEVALTDPTAVRTTVAGFGAVQTWFTTSGAAARSWRPCCAGGERPL